MLKQLKIKDFAIIEDLEIDFNDGFTVITGETGAGKSIIIEALNLILGERAINSMIKETATKSFIFGVFAINEKVSRYLDSQDIEFNDTLELTRVLNVNGKSTFKVNGQIVPLSIIKEIRNLLIEIKKQSDNDFSDDEEFTVNIIDNIGMVRENQQFKRYIEVYKQYVETKNKLKNIHKENSNVDLEFIKDQIKRIESLDVYEGEYEELIRKSKLFSDFVETSSLVAESKELIDFINENLDKLKFNIKKLDEAGYTYSDSFNTAYMSFENFSNEFSVEVKEVSAQEIDYIEERIYEIKRLFSSYGGDYESLQSNFASLKETVYNLENSELVIEELTSKLGKLESEMEEVLISVNSLRDEAIKKIENTVNELLSQMYMDDASIKITKNESEFNMFGNISYEIQISTNNNRHLPITQIASGGEKARVMLAIKYLIAKYLELSTIIFDEIDTGVSGRVAKSMGKVMKDIANFSQVIAITHLPQVAAQGARHLKVEKSKLNDEVVSDIKLLNEESRVKELATMLSGENVSKEALDNAMILMKEANDEV